jgi:hypothetical protein
MVLLSLSQYFWSCRVSKISTSHALFPIVTDGNNKFKQTKKKKQLLARTPNSPVHLVQLHGWCMQL